MKAFFGVFTLFGVMGCGGGTDTAPGDETGAASMGSSAGAGGAEGGSAGAGGALGGSAGTGDEATGGAAGSPPTTFTLSVSVDGGGKVTSTPAGITCGSSCQGTFPTGTQVQLVAKEEGGVLSGWGDACSGKSACSVTLGADAHVSATFAPFNVGANAHGVAVTPDGTHALVTLSENPGTLKVISLADGSTVDSITVGSFPGAVAVTPDGTKAVVNNLNTVSVVTLATKAVANVPSPCVGDTLYDIAVTPDGSSAVAAMFNGSCVTGTVTVISLGSASIANQYPVPGDLTGGIAIASDGSSALVGHGILGTKVSRVALSGGAVTDITNTSASFGITVTPDGSEALVASGDGDTIKRVSLASNAMTGSIDYAANEDPRNIAVTPDGTLAVAVGSFDVGVLSLATGQVLKTFSTGGRSVAITRDGKRALVTLGSTLRVYSLQL